MRLIGSSFSGEWNHAVRRQRMEELLGVFRLTPYWHRSDAEVGAMYRPPQIAIAPAVLAAWDFVVKTGKAIPPCTVREGIEAWLELHNASENVPGLSAAGDIRLVGRRAAAHGFGWRTWSLVIDGPVEQEPDDFESAVANIFGEITEMSDVLILREPDARLAARAASILVSDAIDSDATSLLRAWMKARALNAHELFIEMLNDPARKLLTEKLAFELLAAKAALGFDVDVAFASFAGRGHWRPRPGPRTRMAAVLHVEQELSLNWRPSSFLDEYFDDVAYAIAATGTSLSIGCVLAQLPPGRAMNSIVEYIRLWRPELIASLTWHVQSVAEGAFAAIGLRALLNQSSSSQRDCAEEWSEIQSHVRWQVLHGSHDADIASALDIAVHDERSSFYEGPGARAMRQPSLTVSDWIDPWRSYIAKKGSSAVVSELTDRLGDRTRRDEDLLRLSIRILSILNTNADPGASKLTEVVVLAYADMLSLDSEAFDPPRRAQLLGELAVAIFAGTRAEPSIWQKWLRPFDVHDYIKAVNADLARTRLSSSEVAPLHDVPIAILTHAAVLAEQAKYLPDLAASDALDVVLELYVSDRRAGLPLKAFAWNNLSAPPVFGRSTAIPVFRSIGLVLAPIDVSGSRVRAWTRASPTTVMLMLLLSGLLEGRAPQKHVDAVRGHAEDKIEACLVAPAPIGKLLAIANLALANEMPELAERCAKAAMEILPMIHEGARATFENPALAVIAGAYVATKRWGEALASKVPVAPGPDQTFVNNMRAQALFETNQTDNALVMAAAILKREAANALALATVTACHARKAEWQCILDVADGARKSIARLPDAVLKNYSLALARLERGMTVESDGDIAVSLDSVSNEARHSRIAPQVELDVVILTVIRDEYDAAVALLAPDPGYAQAKPGDAAFMGTVRGASGDYRVAVAMIGLPGNVDSALSTYETVLAHRPRHVVLTGVAGGFKEQGVALGDVVLASEVYGYEYGKMEETFDARVTKMAPVDPHLLSSGLAFSVSHPAWHGDLSAKPGTDADRPKFHTGTVASGEKVMDDQRGEFFQSILGKVSKLHAIEMEAYGVARAIVRLQGSGFSVGFAVVRGISDTPVSGEDDEAKKQAGQRDAWKPYAAGAAAKFVVSWIASGWVAPPIALLARQKNVALV